MSIALCFVEIHFRQLYTPALAMPPLSPLPCYAHAGDDLERNGAFLHQQLTRTSSINSRTITIISLAGSTRVAIPLSSLSTAVHPCAMFGTRRGPFGKDASHLHVWSMILTKKGQTANATSQSARRGQCPDSANPARLGAIIARSVIVGGVY